MGTGCGVSDAACYANAIASLTPALLREGFDVTKIYNPFYLATFCPLLYRRSTFNISDIAKSAGCTRVATSSLKSASVQKPDLVEITDVVFASQSTAPAASVLWLASKSSLTCVLSVGGVVCGAFLLCLLFKSCRARHAPVYDGGY